MTRALVAMSGGVDSAVAALMTKALGYTAEGVTIRFFGDDIKLRDGACGTGSDALDAAAICHGLEIPHRNCDFSEAFKREVISRFVSEYQMGRTPNPCVFCNKYVKLGMLFDLAKGENIQKVVTGHYAQTVYDSSLNRWLLRKGADTQKDQSYVLWSLTQDELSMLLLPLGGQSKDETRRMASEHGFSNSKKPDSQDICFVANGDYGAFIREYTGKELTAGDFVTIGQDVIGKHRGLECYTVGQRRGLGVSDANRLYVLQKNAENGQVVLGDNSMLFSSQLEAQELNWIAIPELSAPIRVKARTRYHQAETPATVTPLENGRVRVDFDLPVRAIASGQSVVFYDGDIVIGGGYIC